MSNIMTTSADFGSETLTSQLYCSRNCIRWGKKSIDCFRFFFWVERYTGVWVYFWKINSFISRLEPAFERDESECHRASVRDAGGTEKKKFS